RSDVVRAFLAASQQGDFSALLAVLDPDVVLRADGAAVAASIARASRDGGVPLASEIRGREAVAAVFRNRARAARLGTVEGDAALVFVFGGRPGMIVEFAVEGGFIVEVSFTGDPSRVATLDVAL